MSYYSDDNFDHPQLYEEENEMSNPPYENMKCPECEGPMISRNGKFGVFWGCKDFPNCRGTRDSQGRSKQDRAKEKGESYELDDKDVSNRFSFKRTR